MRKLIAFAACLIFCSACTDSSDSKSSPAKSQESTAAKLKLPYTVDNASWEWGSDSNVLIAMNALKGFQTGEIDEMRQLFQDSVYFRGDYFRFNGKADSLLKVFKKFRSNYNDYNIKMEDYESVKNKTNGDEYVSLWYYENFTDTKGKVDSIFVMDDIQIANGRIKGIDSKVRHFPAATPQK